MNTFSPPSILPIIAGVLALASLAACNTVRGAAQDVQAGGAAIEGAATDAQADIERERAKQQADRAALEEPIQPEED